ncbi:hypothetical protein GDO81_030215 [Engystomops pustulosus]|uniref:Uncharacterized protein n=1 Tax=Engystomops pustulosus TaxID=76066 RepID=A0AAV6ZE60_ENGPU|nr:hypothetical protein GDO81_030215 [Engystomops pustulosus]
MFEGETFMEENKVRICHFWRGQDVIQRKRKKRNLQGESHKYTGRQRRAQIRVLHVGYNVRVHRLECFM